MSEETEEKTEETPVAKMEEEQFEPPPENEEEDEEVWIEKLPRCSFRNLSVMMTTCMENAFFRYVMMHYS